MTAPSRHALVTGAASGIGRAVAGMLLEQGWQVGLADIDGAALGKLARQSGKRATALPVDVTDPASVASMFERFAERSKGQLELLVNCAGLLYTGHFEDQPAPELARLLAVNNLGIALCCQAALPLLRKSAAHDVRPAVVNLSSASAMLGIPSMASYSASKFWVRGFTEALATEWARYGITVRDVMPPFVNTPMLHGRTDNLFVKRLGVTLDPAEVARQVLAAADGGPLHRPVSWHFKALLLASSVIPAAVARGALGLIGGYPRARNNR
ncbi:MAG TPA: SDR family NAD(P)-dependent oxidoreductase [Noviherbaspirillum sp.]|nr:SDR family NAD(P)-dependent oxidoreductase [Noviherbaspirillum sp.]